VKELLGAPEHYQVVFLGGGASMGFHMVPLNYMKPGGKSAYANTGEWATRAIKESKLVGETLVVASSEDKNFSYIPKGFEIPADADYFHFTSNNTIFGTQWKQFPKSPVPVVCDMSSDIFSRPVKVSDFVLIYGGAQKNMGPAGATVYLFDPERTGNTGRKLSPMLDLKNHGSKESMYNTPPVFAVYVSMLTLQWMKKMGGVAEIEKRNNGQGEIAVRRRGSPADVQGHHRRGGPQCNERHLRDERRGARARLRCAVERSRHQRHPRTPQRGRLPRQHVQRPPHRERAGPGGRDG
jgi:phosphoserine aminotransferase